ncbi:type II toxin-antitoxin system RelE/ParE family toxin [Synechococcus sp. PCC 7336]|uniref:type II toxin-antitoxin system RelE family toxin n=1 Tax=Synechococcus sp. PCC 7336 TaxID=195250 RepID=UPI0003613AA0|nr:type II toxin-antitoxin system RelE/ParE family toxin [Synechococcus sp. PCC 7336]
MPFDIILSPEAVEDLRSLSARHQSNVADAIERHLRHQPDKVSRSRIKRLRGLLKPQYRLRIDDYRVFYDIIDDAVEILAIVHKPSADRWLQRFGEPK